MLSVRNTIRGVTLFAAPVVKTAAEATEEAAIKVLKTAIDFGQEVLDSSSSSSADDYSASSSSSGAAGPTNDSDSDDDYSVGAKIGIGLGLTVAACALIYACTLGKKCLDKRREARATEDLSRSYSLQI